MSMIKRPPGGGGGPPGPPGGGGGPPGPPGGGGGPPGPPGPPAPEPEDDEPSGLLPLLFSPLLNGMHPGTLAASLPVGQIGTPTFEQTSESVELLCEHLIVPTKFKS